MQNLLNFFACNIFEIFLLNKKKLQILQQQFVIEIKQEKRKIK